MSKWVVGVVAIDPKDPKKLKVIHKNVKIKNGPTSGALKNGEFAGGPLMLQGGMGAVAYRHIRIRVPGH